MKQICQGFDDKDPPRPDCSEVADSNFLRLLLSQRLSATSDIRHLLWCAAKMAGYWCEESSVQSTNANRPLKTLLPGLTEASLSTYFAAVSVWWPAGGVPSGFSG